MDSRSVPEIAPTDVTQELQSFQRVASLLVFGENISFNSLLWKQVECPSRRKGKCGGGRSTVGTDSSCWVVLARGAERDECRRACWAAMLELLSSLVLVRGLVYPIFLCF